MIGAFIVGVDVGQYVSTQNWTPSYKVNTPRPDWSRHCATHVVVSARLVPHFCAPLSCLTSRLDTVVSKRAMQTLKGNARQTPFLKIQRTNRMYTISKEACKTRARIVAGPEKAEEQQEQDKNASRFAREPDPLSTHTHTHTQPTCSHTPLTEYFPFA